MNELPITHRGGVMPWECDLMGHMNVTWYVSKFDQATWPLLGMIGFTGRYMQANGVGVGAVQYNVTYKREMLAGDALTVRSRFLEVREKVLRYVHEMYFDETGELMATAEVTAVHMDTTKRKSCPFDSKILERARAMLAEHEKIPRPE